MRRGPGPPGRPWRRCLERISFLREISELFSGKRSCDILIKNAKVVDVFSQEVLETPVAVYKDTIVAFEELPSLEVFDAKGLFLSPGLADCHIHIESTMLKPSEFCRAVLRRGTTAVFADPHEIANSLGENGIWYMLKSTQDLPLDVYILLPSCVPATPFETSGGVLDAGILARFSGERRVVGLAEFMNVPGVLSGDEECLRKLVVVDLVDGHAPMLSGKALSQYIAMGVDSDHETVGFEEGLEKLRKGMFLYIREGTSEKNLKDLVPLIKPERSEFFGFATDDRSPKDLLELGHMDDVLRKAVGFGLKPELAIKIASLNAFRRFRIPKKGAIAPGYKADLVFFKDLKNFEVEGVIKDGRWVYRDGDYAVDIKEKALDIPTLSFRIPDMKRIKEEIRLDLQGKRIMAIEVVPGQIITRKRVVDNPEGLLKVVVIERHKGTGNIGVGFLYGLGVEEGALATTVAHDSHNLIVAGKSDEDILKAVEVLKGSGGGMVVVKDGKVLSHLPLPIGGLMSDRPFEEVVELYQKLDRSARSLGSQVLDNPFMYLSFVALPVIPSLRITDKGLFDVDRFSFVDLFL